jgi:TolA-binding protein
MPRTLARWSAAAIAFALLAAASPAQQVPAEQQAAMILGAARKAYTDRNYPLAVEKFKEFLQKFGGNSQAPSARFALAVTYLEMPERKYNEALGELQQIAGNKGSPDFPQVVYYIGLIKRQQGVAELAQGIAKPNEAQQRKQTANQRFNEAQQQFTACVGALRDRVKLDPAAKELTPEQEWLPRALCDLAEMELRLNQPKEAREAVAELAKDGALAKSRYRRLGLYYHGYASFLLDDFAAAARALNRQELLNDPVFGTHARYLMGRVHQHDGEFAEAAAQYQAVLEQYAKEKAAAQESLKRPEQFKNLPEEKARLESIVKAPPEHVISATFAAATLLYEASRFGDALARFQEFAKANPNSPRAAEAQLHVGFCQTQIKQYNEAAVTLNAVAQKYPQLADQALLWLGKSQAANFDPNNPQSKKNALTAGIKTLRQAAEKAQQLANNDATARQRRAEILLELADTQQLAGQSREAAGVYEQLLNEKVLTHRAEELTQRLADAWHLAGDYQRSDQICDQFLKTFPQSPLRPAVAFRQAENSYFVAVNLAKNPNAPKAERDKAFDAAAARFQAIIDKYPEFERLSLARYSLAVCHIQKGNFEKAQEVLEAIPGPDRTGELAIVPYQLASCMMKLAPTRTDDAIAAGKLQELLQNAAQLLDGFTGANPQLPEVPDALLKLGHCQQRLFAVLAQPPEKQAALQAARAAYEKLMNQYKNDVRVPQAIMERARCMALAGDRGGAMNELRRFATQPLQSSSVAPMALLRLATLHREQNQPVEAAKVLDEARKKHEAALAGDKEHAGWIQLLRYHQAVALLEANKPAEARPLFDQVAKEAQDKPVAAEAALRGGQCRMQETRTKIDTAKQKLGNLGPKPEDKANAEKGVNDAYATVAEAGKYLEDQSDAFKQALPTAEPRARMLYDAAWAYRFAAEHEVAAARAKTQAETKKDVPRSKVPIQPSENKARDAYKKLIDSFGDLPLAGEARLELSELHAEREEHEPAAKLLREALDKEPPQELTDRIRLRLGCCLASLKDAKGALQQFDSISDPKSPLHAQAQYRAGEALLELNQPQDAAKRLAVFRDKGEFQNIGGLTDRALLRLAHALAKAGQWEPSRQACEQVVNRFGNGPWALEARYGIGWARQQMKQYDDAINWYTQVVSATTTELGAKAQLQIGLCRLEQKKYAEAANALLVVPYTYDYPELTPVALVEAARALTETKQKDQAEKLLQRVLREYEGSEWAKVAKERLEALKKN